MIKVSFVSPMTGGPAALATGTLSASPDTMLNNALPFRRQLEASTATVVPPAAMPALPRDDRFVVPVAADAAGALATKVGARDDDPASTSDQSDDAHDESRDGLAPMIGIADYFAPPSAANGLIGNPAVANVTPPAKEAPLFVAARSAPSETATPGIDSDDAADSSAALRRADSDAPAATIAPATVSALPTPPTTLSSAAARTAPLAAPTLSAATSVLANARAVVRAPAPADLAPATPTSAEPVSVTANASAAAGAAAPRQAAPDAPRSVPVPLSADATIAPAAPADKVAQPPAAATPTHMGDANTNRSDVIAQAFGRTAFDRAPRPATPGHSEVPATEQASASRPLGESAAPAPRPAEEFVMPARSADRIAPQSGPISAADLAAPQVANGVQGPAAQGASTPAGSATQTAQHSPAPIPFDQHFGQRIGGAISAAMGAMAVKDGAIMLQISPDHFGKIEIEIDSRIERLQITTENEAVRSAIAQAHGRIEQELRQAGQRVTTIEVATRDGAERHDGDTATNQRGGQNNAPHSNGARHDPRTLSPKHDGPSRDDEAELPRPASNVFYA